jgi:hypothetical protein
MSFRALVPGAGLLLLACLVASVSATVVIVSQTPGASRTPDLAVDPYGQLLVVWADSTTGVGQILYCAGSPPDGWGPVEAVSSGANDAANPSVACLPDGTPFVAWQERVGDERRIFAAFRGPQGWEPFEVAPSVPGHQGVPDAHVRPDGTPWVAWEDPGGGVWVSDLQQVWNPLDLGFCSVGGGPVLVDAGSDLAVVTTVPSQEGPCLFAVSLWDGQAWSVPPGTPAEATGPVAAASRPGSSTVHLAALPGLLPTCPCWDLYWTPWDPPSGWGDSEILNEAPDPWWTATDPSLALDEEGRPLVAYLYEALDDAWNVTTRDVVLATRQGPGLWDHQGMEVPVEAWAESPVAAFVEGMPVVAWSALADGIRQICLWAPVSSVEEGAPVPVASLRAVPNPASGPLEIRWTALDGPATVLVMDASGRRVGALRVAAGVSRVRWEWRDARGRGLPSGVYLLRVLARGREVGSAKVLYVR